MHDHVIKMIMLLRMHYMLVNEDFEILFNRFRNEIS